MLCGAVTSDYRKAVEDRMHASVTTSLALTFFALVIIIAGASLLEYSKTAEAAFSGYGFIYYHCGFLLMGWATCLTISAMTLFIYSAILRCKLFAAPAGSLNQSATGIA